MAELRDQRYNDFDSLMLRHKGLVRALCWWYAGSDRAKIDDLMQEMLTSLWHYRHTLRADATAVQERAWVKLHCKSVIQHQRRRKQMKTENLNEGLAVAEPTDEQREQLMALAESLTDHERQLLDLLLDGYRVGEIAEVMHIKAASVSQLRYRMIEKMKNEAQKIQ